MLLLNAGVFAMKTLYSIWLYNVQRVFGKDGWDFLSEIRDHPDAGKTPCIAVTAFLHLEGAGRGFTCRIYGLDPQAH